MQNSRVVFLELGVGMNTHGIIKYPFWQMTANNPNATYICLNKGDTFSPKEIRARSIYIDGDVGEAIAQLK